MDIAPDSLVQIGCVVIAVVGLVMLVLAMVRFEQRRAGAVTALIVGGVLVLAPVGIVVWDSWSG